jgi:hypothetical protein
MPLGPFTRAATPVPSTEEQLCASPMKVVTTPKGVTLRMVQAPSVTRALPVWSSATPTFLEAAPTSPYLQGSPRLKLRLLPEETRKKFSKIALTRPEFSAIADAVQVSEEVFQTWIYDLKKNSATLFNEIADDLILGMCVNVAFIKPYSDSVPLRALRGNTIEFLPLHERPELPAFNELAKDFLKFRQEFYEANVKFDRIFASLEQLIVTKYGQTDHTLEIIKQSTEIIEKQFEQQNQIISEMQHTVSAMQHTLTTMPHTLTAMQHTLSAYAVPFHIKLVRKFRQLFNLTH